MMTSNIFKIYLCRFQIFKKSAQMQPAKAFDYEKFQKET